MKSIENMLNKVLMVKDAEVFGMQMHQVFLGVIESQNVRGVQMRLMIKELIS